MDVRLPDGTIIINVPEGTTQSELMRRVGLMPAPPAAPVKDAGFSLGDIAKSFGMGVTGSTKALTDVAGAGNVVSSKLEGATESLQKSLTPERQAEMERQAARMKAAEESGSILQEIKAGALNVAEAPLQSAAQAIGSFVPYLLSTPVAAGMRLTGASKAVIEAVAKQAPKTIATAQGAGAVKGSIYDGVLRAEIEAGVNPEEAKQKATAAQDYFGKNFEQIALGGGLGFVAGSSGVEKFLTPAGRVGAAPGMGRRVGEAVVKETLPEAAQGGQERLAQNIALQREGYDVDTFKGVAGAATQEALTGALGAAPIAALAKPDTTVAAKKERDKFEQEEAEFRKQFGKAEPVEVKEPELPTEFPGGYTATRRELSRQDVPESFGIFPEGSDKPLTTVKTQEEAQAKLQTLTEIRAEEQARLLAESDKIDKEILAERRKLDVLEATGQTDTDQYVQSKAALLQREEEAAQQVSDLNDRIASYSTPLTLAPVGSRTDVQSDYVVKRGDQEIGAFPTLQDAELKLRELEPDTFKQAEQQARVETDDRVTQLKNTLTPMLAKFGLQDVGLNVVNQIENDAGGSYLDRLINISLTEANPIQTMRHESMHALKDLQFFTPQQWNVLTERANKEWIKTYLADVPTELNGVQMSRLDAYKKLGLTQEEIVEEAISDAFGAYDKGATPPPGMIAALFKKLKNFFANFGQALRGAGFESADDVFQRVERGELKSRKPKAETKKVAEEEIEKPEQTMGERLSLLRKANPDEIDISTQNPQGVKRIYDPITEMLSIDEAAVREAMKANPKMAQKTIQAIKSYGFIPNGTPNNKVLELFRENIVNNLMFLYNKVPADIRNRSKLWYDGANKIASEMADNYDMSLRQVAAIMAAMSPQKDWFQNVSMAERAIDILKKQGDQAWTPEMLKYAESYVKETQDRKEREKRGDAFEKIKKVAKAGTVLNDMDEKSAAAFVRAYDEAFHSRNYRIVTPEGGFGDLVKNNDGKPSTMMWSTYGPIEKAVSIFRDGSRANVSEQLGFEHKIRSFYNNIANPNSEIDHVTIDTHAVAAALFEALAGTDTEVTQNFGGTGSSDVLGVGGTYGLIADAYREAAKKAGVRAREMQSITWEAVRALFSEEVKSTIKPKIRAEWKKYKTGQQSFDETRQNVLEIAGQPDKLDEPDWIDSGVGQFVSDGGTSYDKTFTPTGGVRLREEREIREKVTFNLSAVTNSIPGLRELYSNAMKGDNKAYELLQKVAESSLQYLLKGTGAKIKVEYSKGVYLSDREPSISVSAAFGESDQRAVMGALAKFAENYNQQQIHVRVPTIRKVGHDFDDGSYATPVYEIALRKKLNNAQISDIINQTGLQGFSVSERQVSTKDGTTTENFLTAYWVAPNDIDKEFESFDKFEQAIRAAQALAGVEGAKPKQSVERLYVYGEGPGARIRYEDIQSDILSREGTDTVTPRLISEYLRGEPVRVFKQKDLTNKQVEGQRLLAKIFDELPTKDLKNPLVRRAYNALNKELLEQYNVMPIKVKLVEGKRDEDGNFIDIYKNSAEMRKDVSDNNRFKVYKTEPGTFGPEGFNFSDHPLLKDSGVKDANGKPMLFNDVLRAVHDYYAHNLADIQFGPKGEAAAWRNHMSVTADPLARWALTAETRAQNAWQNFREGVEDTPLKDRPYADQKAMLPPIAFTFTGEADVDQVMADYAATLTPEQQLGSLPPTSQYAGDVKKQMPKLSLRTYFPTAREAENAAYDKAPPSTKEFKLFFGGSTIMDEGRPQPMYHGSASGFDTFNESKPIFVSPEPGFAEQFAEDRAKDEGKSLDEMRIYPLWVRAETPFDYENKDHAEMVAQKIITDQKLSGPDSVVRLKKSNPKANTFKKEIAGGLWSTIEDPVVQDALKSFGFDSFYVQEYGNKNLAVFKAEQVKSITGNIGDFSLESKDMRFSLPTIPQNLQDRMGETTSRRERKTVIQSIVDAIRPTSAADFRAKYLNRYNQMSVYDKKLAEKMGGAALLADQSAESAALMSDLGAGVAASAMGFDDRNGGIPVLRNGITTIDKSVKGLIASLAPLAQYNDPAVYQRYQYWAMVKRGDRLNKNGTLTGIDSADLAYAKILEQKHPEFVSVQKDLIAFNNGLVQYMVDTGVLSKERGQMYTKYADYIPFYRQMDGDKTLGPNLFQSLSGVKPPKKLKGAIAEEAPLADFLETMVRNTQSSIQAGIKNYAAQRALNVAVQVKVPGMGAERLNYKDEGPNIINVLEKGNLVSYRTPDTLLINAMMSLNQSELPFIGFLSAPADLLRNLVTKEPGFMMANMMRDSLSAWVTSGQSMTPIAGTVINFGKALARKSPGFEAMLDAGIIGGYEFNENIEKSGFKLEDDLAKKAGKKDPILLRPFTSVWDALGKGTTASDAATRALIYERVLADTGNEAEALYRSLEVMNFHRKGSSPLIRVLTAAVPFFNARLQGLDLFYRASTGNMNNKDAASIQRQFFLRGMTMMALSGLYWMMVSDDEEYKKQEQETKDNNWIIPSLGVKIPIPFEVGVLFKVIPERIMAYSFGNDTGEDLQKSMIRAAVSTFAFNPIPQTVKPVLEAVVDYNMFTMRPILGQGMKDIEPEFQVGPSTSNFAKLLAQNLGLSPMKVDHIIKGYTGTIGMYAIDTIDIVLDQFGDSPKPTKRFEQHPVIKRFASDPEARGFVTQYYELKDSVDTTVRTMNLLEKTSQPEEYTEYLIKNQGTLAFKDYVRDTEKTMTYLREMKVAIRASTMTGDEKRDSLLEISRMESAITSNIQEIKKAIAQSQ
jgi:hypothetical protein